MDIRELIRPEHAVIGVKAQDKEHVISELAMIAAQQFNLDAAEVARELLKRESLGSTGIGGGVAIPHARLHQVTKPSGVAARLKRLIDFEAVDCEPVDLVFILLMPALEATAHLNALACVSRTLRDKGRLQRLRGASDADVFYAALTS